MIELLGLLIGNVPINHPLRLCARPNLQLLAEGGNVLSIFWTTREQLQRQNIVARLSEQLAWVCEAVEVPYLEVFATLQQVSTWKEEIASNDGSHPRARGYATLTQLIQVWSAWRVWLT
jgi:lysophospholipase L1-like esterase